MSDLSGNWAAGLFADAPAVPVWTKPSAARFTARGHERSAGFNAWASEPAAPPAAAAPHADEDAIRTEAYAQGFNDGHAAAVAAFDMESAAFERLAAAIADIRAEPPADLARLLSETVSRLVRQVVGEVRIDNALMAERTAAIAALIADDSAPPRLRLNPADVARVQGLRPDLALIADPALSEGSVVAETAGGWVEDGPAIRLEKLRAQLDALGCRR